MRIFWNLKAFAIIAALATSSLVTVVVIIGLPGRTLAATGPPQVAQSLAGKPIARTKSATSGMIIDHNAVDAAVIPLPWLDQARALDTFFGHKSVGNNILDGMVDLQVQNSERYTIAMQYGWPNWFADNDGILHRTIGTNYYPETKIDAFNTHLRDDGFHVADVAMMKFCPSDVPPFSSTPAADTWVAYRDMMNALEHDYPGVTFVWWTISLMTADDNRGNDERAVFNGLVREYCAASGCLLFDIADIESHDPDGSPIVGPTGHEAMYNGYSDDGAHLNEMGRQRVANAFWWLLARAAGWAGTSHWISMSADDNEAGVYPGEAATYNLAVTASEGFSQPITLALQGAPAGTSVSFDPNPVAAPGGSQLYVTTTAATRDGVYAMTATGAAGQLSAEIPLTLTVKPVFSLTTRPFFRTALPGEVVTYSLSVTAGVGFATPVTFTLHGETASVHVSFEPDSVVPPATSQLYITTTTATEVGIYAMTVTGASGALTDTASLTLIAASAAPSFTLGVSPDIRIARPNQVVSYTALMTAVNGLSGPVNLTVVGLPVGVGATWSVNPVMPGDPSILSLAISDAPLFGDHALDVVATTTGTTSTQVVTRGIGLVIWHLYKLWLPSLHR